MKDDPEPIKDGHKVFAAELVALARKHGANYLEVKFRLTGGRRMFEDQYDPTNVRFTWCEGRHGERSRYGLYAEAHISVEEPKKERDQ
jgi:hypothetical protein